MSAQPRQSTHFAHQLYGPAMALCVADTARQHDSISLVILPNTQQAEQFSAELRAVSDLPVWLMPDWEILPYDRFSPHQDIISERLQLLMQLQQTKTGICVVAINTLMHRLAPPAFLQQHALCLKAGDTRNLQAWAEQLTHAGYRASTQVIDHGEFAVRGAILDVFPMGCEQPFRIDWFDDEIDSIRHFDPETQRSTDKVDEIRLLPAHEFPFNDDSIAKFRQHWRETFAGNPLQTPIYQDVSEGLCPAGIEYYLPLFFEKTATLFDYLPQDHLVISINNTQASGEQFWQETYNRYQQLSHDVLHPILSPQKILLSQSEWRAYVNMSRNVELHTNVDSPKSYWQPHHTQALPDIRCNHKETKPLRALSDWINRRQARVLFTVESAGRREVLLTLLRSAGIVPKMIDRLDDFVGSKEIPDICYANSGMTGEDAGSGMTSEDNIALGIGIFPFQQGCLWPKDNIAIVPESELLGQTPQQRKRKRRRSDPQALIKNLAELQIGTPVVHLEHGIGRYMGLKTLTLNTVTTEFIILEYNKKETLYVPVSSLELISRYTGGNAEQVTLDKLGNDRWEKTKRKAQEKIHDVAADLLAIYAEREAKKRSPLEKPDEQYDKFCQQFPFEPTPDQAHAFEKIIDDLTRAQPMDRLICGDVGFGKTEVSMRAAFLAVKGQRQVAVLVPTTLLAQQHWKNFQDRFADWPMNVEMLSRFRTTKEQNQVIEGLSTGRVDIVIGTHKLLTQPIKFKQLGLLVIDEEHRFGVKQKEKIKQWRANVDILAMTATPIPRTLNMAMHHIRDLSIIATPPEKRLSIKTFVQEKQTHVIKEAIQREVLRGGQVYYLHNNVDTIERCKTEIELLVPEARVVFAHGQMRERELERIMADFYHRRFHVLVCTTIIETGIDVPSANTIVIERADKFGLAQLHQLRGRVGRSHHQAYAYLLTPHESAVSKDAEKRLEAISTFEDLGAGFVLATHDLEIRGAGALLGEEQSGHIEAIGFSLYMEMLEQAVTAMKSGKQVSLDSLLQNSVEVNLHISALIPESYLSDTHARLVLYKRLASAETTEEIDDMQAELIDRFGPLPDPIQHLLTLSHLKLRAKTIGIQKIDANAAGGLITFTDKPQIDPMRIIQLMQRHPDQYQFAGQDRLRYKIAADNAGERIAALQGVLSALDGDPASNAG